MSEGDEHNSGEGIGRREFFGKLFRRGPRDAHGGEQGKGIAEDVTKPDKVQVSKRQWSRREFVRTMAQLTAGGIVEAKTGVLGDMMFDQVGELLDGLGWEGNPSQFLGVTADLAREVVNNPEDQRAKDVLGAWVKFNGAVHYGHLKGMDMAAGFVNHFLYGDGEKLDVSGQLKETIHAFVENVAAGGELETIGLEDIPSNKNESVAAFMKGVLASTESPPYLWHSEGP